jgi:hypothetical protein
MRIYLFGSVLQFYHNPPPPGFFFVLNVTVLGFLGIVSRGQRAAEDPLLKKYDGLSSRKIQRLTAASPAYSHCHDRRAQARRKHTGSLGFFQSLSVVAVVACEQGHLK